MTTELIELIKDFIAFNKYKTKKIKLKEYLMQELNYCEDDAIDIVKLYNIGMMYS